MAISENKIFISLDSGVFISTDNGKSWRQEVFDLTNPRICSFAMNGNNLFAGALDSGKIYYSSDFGNSWALKRMIPYDFGYVSSLKIIDKYIFGLTERGVIISTDNGDSWNTANNGFKFESYGIKLNSLEISHEYIFAGTNYNSMYRAKLSDFGISDVPNKEPLSDAFTIFPNPVQNTLNIHIEQKYQTPGQMQILDIFGQKVKECNIPVGLHDFKMETEGLSKGIYFINLKNGALTETRKFVVK